MQAMAIVVSYNNFINMSTSETQRFSHDHPQIKTIYSQIVWSMQEASYLNMKKIMFLEEFKGGKQIYTPLSLTI